MRRIVLTAAQYRQVAELALVFLTLTVFIGAAVRLSGSGLGCPDRPKCYGKVPPPLETHIGIEVGNRLLSGLVGLVAVAAGLLPPFWPAAQEPPRPPAHADGPPLVRS